MKRDLIGLKFKKKKEKQVQQCIKTVYHSNSVECAQRNKADKILPDKEVVLVALKYKRVKGFLWDVNITVWTDAEPDPECDPMVTGLHWRLNKDAANRGAKVRALGMMMY